MKTALAVTLALLLTVSAAVSALCPPIYGAKENVSFHETLLYGDRNALHGTEIETHMTWEELLYWDTILRPGETDSETTICTVHNTKQPALRKQHHTGVQMQISYDSAYDRDTPEEERTGLALAFDTLYNETAPGEEKSKTVYMKDYYTYYPWTFQLDFPEFSASWGTDEPTHHFYYNSPSVRENAWEVLKALDSFFKIPVLEDEQVELFLGRSTNGYSTSYGITPGAGGSDAFFMSMMSVLGKSAAYFTFTAETKNGNTVDTSQIPGGYGIYVLPYEVGKNGTVIDHEGLRMTYALSPSASIVSLSFGSNEETLHLYTLEDGIPVLTVIATDTMETLQRLEILHTPVENFEPIFIGENFLVVIHDWEKITLLTKSADGTYAFGFTTEAAPEVMDLQYVGYDAKMAFDGERLMVVQYKQRGFYHCDFLLRAYTKEGVQCIAEYACSLNAGLSDESNYQYHCTPSGADSLSIRFTE